MGREIHTAGSFKARMGKARHPGFDQLPCVRGVESLAWRQGHHDSFGITSVIGTQAAFSLMHFHGQKRRYQRHAEVGRTGVRSRAGRGSKTAPYGRRRLLLWVLLFGSANPLHLALPASGLAVQSGHPAALLPYAPAFAAYSDRDRIRRIRPAWRDLTPVVSGTGGIQDDRCSRASETVETLIAAACCRRGIWIDTYPQRVNIK